MSESIQYLVRTAYTNESREADVIHNTLSVCYPLTSDATKKSGHRLIGDVDYNDVSKVQIVYRIAPNFYALFQFSKRFRNNFRRCCKFHA